LVQEGLRSNCLAGGVPPKPDKASPLIGYFKKFWTNPRP
jgi:hypothetical protein